MFPQLSALTLLVGTEAVGMRRLLAALQKRQTGLKGRFLVLTPELLNQNVQQATEQARRVLSSVGNSDGQLTEPSIWTVFPPLPLKGRYGEGG